MSSCRFTLIVFISIGLLGLLTKPAVASDLTITLEKTVHFTTPSGEDAVVEPGTYRIETGDGGLRILPPGSQGKASIHVQADSLQTEVLLDAPQVDSRQVGEDHHQLLAHLPDGTLLAADGSYTGVISRGTYSKLTLAKRYSLLVPRSRLTPYMLAKPSSPSSPSPTPTPTPPQATLWDQATIQHNILTPHNSIRAGAVPAPTTPLPLLRWNQQVADVAAGWAKQCRMEHNPQKGMLGENLFVTSQTTASDIPNKAVTSWAAEAKKYDYQTNSCAPGYCFHYTQIVWRKTTDLGCAVATCPTISNWSGGTLVVCNYSPPGNWVGERPY